MVVGVPLQDSPGGLSLAMQSLLGIFNAFVALMMYYPIFLASVCLGYIELTSGLNFGGSNLYVPREDAKKINEAFNAFMSNGGGNVNFDIESTINKIRAVFALTIILGVVEVITYCVSTVAWQLNMKFIHFAVCGLRVFELILCIIVYALALHLMIMLIVDPYMKFPGGSTAISHPMSITVNGFISMAFHVIFIFVTIGCSVVLALKGGQSSSGPVAAPPVAPGGALPPPAPGVATPVVL